VNSKSFLILVFVAAYLFVNGCLPLKQDHRPKTYSYALEYKQDYFIQEKKPVILKIRDFNVAPEFDVMNLVYQESKYKYHEYPYHRWRKNPGDLIASCLKRDLIDSQIYQAVIGTESQLLPTHILEGSVDAIYEKDTADGWYAVLTLTITLEKMKLSNDNLNVLFQKTFATKKRVDRKDPIHVVQAMSSAMNELSLKIQKKIYQVLSQ